MANISKLFPSKYLKAADLDGEELEVVIDQLDEEMIGQGKDQEMKPVLKFRNHDQGLVLNKTNANLIADDHGDDYEKWGGETITLYPTQTQFGSKLVDCVRVKPQPKKKTEAVAVGTDDDSGDVPF